LKIIIGNIHAELRDATKEQISRLRSVMSYEHPEKERVRDYRLSEITHKMSRAKTRKEELDLLDKKREWLDWDGRIHLLDKWRLTFPAGLWYLVLGLYPDSEVEGNFITPIEYEEIETYNDINLFDFQDAVVDEIIEYDGRCIVDVGTGGGKTELAMFLINLFKTKTLIVVPNATLEKQWVARMKNHFDMQETDMPRVYQIKNKAVFMVATRSYTHNIYYKTNSKKQEEYELCRLFLRDVGTVIYDECHHASTKQSREILDAVNAYYRIGLSGTVNMRSDNTDIIYLGYLGPVVGKITQKDLVEMGRATEATVIFRPVGQRSYPRNKKYNEIVEDYIVYNDHRNSLIVTEAAKWMLKGKKVLVLTDRVKHIKMLEAMMSLDEETMGRAVGVDANHPDREEMFDKWMNTDEIDIMICTVQLVGEGFDFPNLGAMVLAGTWKSKTRSIQTLGRLIRTSADKNNAIFIDYANNCEYLWEHSVERVKAWRAEGFDVILDGTFLERIPELEIIEEVNFNE